MTAAISPGSAVEATSVVTVTANNSFAVGESVTITGLTPAAYDGTFVVVSATPTSFTYVDGSVALVTSTGTGTAEGRDCDQL